MEAAVDIYRNASVRETRDRLILDHLDHVRHVLGRLTADWPVGLDFENLEAAGVLGLVQAAEQFDPTRGVPFRAFATMRIRGAIIDEVRRNSPLPQEMLRRIGKIREVFRNNGPHVTLQQVAAQTGLTAVQIDDCLAAERLTRFVSGDDVLQQLLQPGSGAQNSPQEQAERLECLSVVAEGIQNLPDRERTVLTLYYHEDLRLKEIGEVLGLSASGISRILAQAELRLAETVRRKLS